MTKADLLVVDFKENLPVASQKQTSFRVFYKATCSVDWQQQKDRALPNRGSW